jgi:predicted enzyme related to lactoylglutathione lyase
VITSVKSIRVPTRDHHRALAFWTQKVGLTVASDQPFEDAARWIELRIPGADTRLVLVTPEAAGPVSGAIAFTADDVNRTYAELKAKGVEFVSPPARADWGTQAVFRDPEGNSFVISSPP